MSELQQDTAKFIVGDDEIVYRLISSVNERNSRNEKVLVCRVAVL